MPASSASRRKSSQSQSKHQKQNQTKLAFHGSHSAITKPSAHLHSLAKKELAEKISKADPASQPSVSPTPASKRPAANFEIEQVSSRSQSPCPSSTSPLSVAPALAVVPAEAQQPKPKSAEDQLLFPDGLTTLLLDAAERIVWKTAMLRARKLTLAHLKSYFAKAESKRLAPRVHADALRFEEKILADWDVDTRYGPCLGITRTQRWQRAHIRYNMDPPTEVLAVLLRENDQSPGSMEEASFTKLVMHR